MRAAFYSLPSVFFRAVFAAIKITDLFQRLDEKIPDIRE